MKVHDRLEILYDIPILSTHKHLFAVGSAIYGSRDSKCRTVTSSQACLCYDTQPNMLPISNIHWQCGKESTIESMMKGSVQPSVKLRYAH